MSPKSTYIRFENIFPPHHKFYEVEAELSLFYLKQLVMLLTN